ncbi:protein translocase subunit SecD [Sediminivirga luteola]|uniref:Protein translocase subunit SecD n=2 Tax=Sediminivirga luteola TaxID=1774748 RepID=A0A8J2XKV7_9MICO|nr:protein translocase subunit SecD [Sediminivirga luteola]
MSSPMPETQPDDRPKAGYKGSESRPGPRFLWLGFIFVLLSGIVGSGIVWSTATPTPELALDLRGGTSIILEPQLDEGENVTPEQLNEAVAIIRQRIDSTGVSEAEINTQGGRNIVVNLPVYPDDRTRELVRASAQLRFRPVLMTGPGQPAVVQQEDPAQEQPDPSEGLSEEGQRYLEELTGGQDAEGSQEADGTEDAPAEESDPEAGGAATQVAAPQPEEGAGEGEAPPADVPGPAGQNPEGSPGEDQPAPMENPSDPSQITEELYAEYEALDCSDPENLIGGSTDDPHAPLVACSQDGSTKFILGPMEVSGATIADASFGYRVTSTGAQTNEPVVNLEFNREGTEQFREVTQRITNMQPPYNQFAIVLDGLVVSAPVSQAIITDGRAQISGSFTRDSAETLANQLKNGSLPISFQVQSEEQISPTLGADYLRSALIAGGIGLVLVIGYALLQYRTLGLLTVSSIGVVAALTYLLLLLVSWRYGYRLSLAGMAGLIIGLGAAADSFIVYFERVRDELRSGRALRSAVEVGWERARRTIYASKAVNMLAAVILYFLAVGSVRGFAFTMGLTVIVDVLIMILFTHPMFQVLARTRFFGDGHPWSGMDPRKLGVKKAAYRGALNIDLDKARTVSEKRGRGGSAKEARRRQTIVERREAAAAAARSGGGTGSGKKDGTSGNEDES